MKNHPILFVSLLCMGTLLLGCSEDKKPEEKKDHIWQQQVDTLKQAKELQNKLNKDTEERQKALEKAVR